MSERIKLIAGLGASVLANAAWEVRGNLALGSLLSGLLILSLAK
jgi:hypothetical protein